MVDKIPCPPCPECKNRNGCQMKDDMEKYFEKLKKCSFFAK